MDIDLIFSQSKVNGGEYYGDLLSAQPWEWPKDTWLQRRLAQIRNEESKKEVKEDT